MTDASHGHSFDSSCPMIALIAVMIPLIAMMRALIIGAKMLMLAGVGHLPVIVFSFSSVCCFLFKFFLYVLRGRIAGIQAFTYQNSSSFDFCDCVWERGMG